VVVANLMCGTAVVVAIPTDLRVKFQKGGRHSGLLKLCLVDRERVVRLANSVRECFEFVLLRAGCTYKAGLGGAKRRV
jgi:hypothetical protein